MGEYRYEGLGNITGGSYDRLNIEGLFNCNSPLQVNRMVCEGIMNVSAPLTTENLSMEGILNVKGPLEAGSLRLDGIIKADTVLITESLEAEGAIHTETLEADSASLYYEEKKDTRNFVRSIRNFIFGKDTEVRTPIIQQLKATKLYIAGYCIGQVKGSDVTIGPDCVIDSVHADGKLRIHQSSRVKNLGSSVTPEYYV